MMYMYLKLDKQQEEEDDERFAVNTQIFFITVVWLLPRVQNSKSHICFLMYMYVSLPWGVKHSIVQPGTFLF